MSRRIASCSWRIGAIEWRRPSSCSSWPYSVVSIASMCGHELTDDERVFLVEHVVDRRTVHLADHLGEIEQAIDVGQEPGVVVLGRGPKRQHDVEHATSGATQRGDWWCLPAPDRASGPDEVASPTYHGPSQRESPMQRRSLGMGVRSVFETRRMVSLVAVVAFTLAVAGVVVAAGPAIQTITPRQGRPGHQHRRAAPAAEELLRRSAGGDRSVATAPGLRRSTSTATTPRRPKASRPTASTGWRPVPTRSDRPGSRRSSSTWTTPR